MGFNLQLLFTGIGVGSIYALVALGFALIYRATNVVNFAQGDFAMLGAFAMVVLAIDLDLPYWISILITLALLICFGVLFNLCVYYPLRNRSFLPVIISTMTGMPSRLAIMITFMYSAQEGAVHESNHDHQHDRNAEQARHHDYF